MPSRREKITRNSNLKIGTYNIRNINEIGKRQELTKWAKDNNMDIILLQETKRNTSDLENGGIWEEYTIFYSTSVDPKVREKEEKSRELRKGTGKGWGKTKKEKRNTHFNAPDYEHAGVAIMIRTRLLKYTKIVQPISGRLMYLILKAEGGNLAIINAYAPTAMAPTEKKDMFYENLNRAINESGQIRIIGGDFNARIYNLNEEEKEYIGNNVIYRAEGYVQNCMTKESKENRDKFLNTLKTHNLAAANTLQEKPQHKRVTYMETYT